MKILHISDLHIGKRVNGYSMLEDQEFIFNRILGIVDEQKTDAVIIAGDVYDKTVPVVEAVELFDRFLVSLTKKNQKVMIISGNHDSAERLSFGRRLMNTNGVYISKGYSGSIEKVVLADEYGEANFYLLPFIKPSYVKRYFEEENIETYTDAVRVAIEKADVDYSKRNILVSHQFVIGATVSGSEEMSVGGLGEVASEVLESFDYVALGHIHRNQRVGKEHIRYCGTPLKYDFSEENDTKKAIIIDIKEKGNISFSDIELKPKRAMLTITGKYDELVKRDYYEEKDIKDAYLQVILTDEEEVPNAMAKLQVIYSHIMKMNYDNTRTRTMQELPQSGCDRRKTPQEIFSELYSVQNNQEVSEEQQRIIDELTEKIWGDESET